MNILILSNSAPDYFRFFNRLAEQLDDDKNNVEIAVDSSYSHDTNHLDSLNLRIHDFAKFWQHFDESAGSVFSEYKNFPINSALHSDFERAELLGFDRHRDMNYYRSLQAALLRFFETIFIESRIELVVYENVSNGFAYIAWLVAKKLGIRYQGLIASRLPGRYSIVDDPLNESQIYSQILEEIISGNRIVEKETWDWVDQYLKGIDTTVPDYMKFNKLDKINIFKNYAKRSKIQRLRRAWNHRNDNHRLAFQHGNPLRLSCKMIERAIKRKIRSHFCEKYFSKIEPGEEFLLYPLHFHPESSTSVNARSYINEYEVVRNIAFSLPIGTLLYVKDHKSAFASPDLNFYRRISSLPNVRLIEPNAPTKQLIRDSIGVATLTSTVGYEALLLNKRVFLFGSVFYEKHPNVVLIENPTKLFEIFQKHLKSPLNAGAEYNRLFVASYYMGTFPGILNFFMKQEEIEELVDQIYPDVAAAFRNSISGTNFTGELVE